MITLETLKQWLLTPAENEHLEFKEAVALGNEGGGYLVLGVTNKPPRQVVGSQAFTDLNKIKAHILNKLKFRVDIRSLQHPHGRVLVFEVPPRPTGQALALDGTFLMRAGEDLVAMTPDKLKRIFAEDQQDWFTQPAKADVSPNNVIALLDTQTYFELLKIPYPTSRDAVLKRLQGENLIQQTSRGWIITNLGAILLAKELKAFSSSLARKAVRFVLYEGTNKLKTRKDVTGNRGYASGFERLVNFVHEEAPQNHIVEEVLREEVKMFPKQAIRELIANALIHQDFQSTGNSVMVEMYTDRIEISNPGIPSIKVERFIDERMRGSPHP